ncbi:DNA topoisomerase I, mitochondrial isoform X3 [Plutella xylostella]|uniref:DNA topoisomerase I, mitochondrial isoform X3 n=1 Tax=Plutella xylostella TaxID=51655 RepID=UPI002032875D|nr:DNA topoisomerase I, mitochondrial isoform X3 [Plutella xylostella]
MSVENPASDNDEGAGKVNGNKNEHVNGMQNGYSSSSDKHKSSHKSSSKDKHRDKDRDHKSSKHSSSSRDKEKHSSSKSHSSSHKSSSKDKERSDKDREHKDRSDRDKERSDRDKERSDRDKKDKERSDKHRSDKDKHRDKDRSDRDRKDSKSNDEKKSSSSSKDKEHKSSSSKDKEHKSKDRDREREKDRHRSDKDKHRSDKDKNSSSKSKHSSKDKEKSSSERNEKIKTETEDSQDISIKAEPMQVDIPPVKKEEDSDDGYAGANNTTMSSCDYSMSQFKDDPLSEIKDEDSEEDTPLLERMAPKRRAVKSESEDDTPLTMRKKPKKKKIKKESGYDEEMSDDEPKAKKPTKTKPAAKVKTEDGPSPTKRKKKQDDEPEVWKWWEEEKKDDGTKWKFLEHKGPLFAPPYEPIPENVKFRYDGKVVRLSQDAEEVAGFYARMLDHDYTTKSVFNNNFFADWRKVMTHDEAKLIKDLKKCDFKEMQAYFQSVSEKNKNRTKEEKAQLKATNEEIQKEYGFCIIDGHKEKIGNFRIEPPGLFRGRGEHPKMGMLKKRVMPEDVLINCSKDSNVPKPPKGHKWKEVRHDNTVTWLASWTENVQGQTKYVMLNPSSKLKGEKDWQKYETARKLHKCIDKIRDTYRSDWKAKEMRVRQRAVALYFIDRLALRAGNEKDDDQADTVGCCSLRVEHIALHKEKDGKEYVVVFDFLGKDSIRYYNEVPVEKRVFKNLELFMENKKDSDDLFDRLNTQTLNEHLKELMPGLTAKVFRTYNASITLQRQLDELTDGDASIPEKILAYNRANRAVAVLCNHQRAVPKGHDKSMEALKEKIQAKRDQIDEAEEDVRQSAKAAKRGSVKEKMNHDKKTKALERLRDQLKKLELQETDRDENKTIALGTSKLNYLDPRISVAWCKKHDVPIEKIYNKTQRDKFRWAIDMAGPEYVF